MEDIQLSSQREHKVSILDHLYGSVPGIDGNSERRILRYHGIPRAHVAFGFDSEMFSNSIREFSKLYTCLRIHVLSRNPKTHQKHFSDFSTIFPSETNVRRFEISMNVSTHMKIFKGFDDLNSDTQGAVHGDCSSARCLHVVLKSCDVLNSLLWQMCSTGTFWQSGE